MDTIWANVDELERQNKELARILRMPINNGVVIALAIMDEKGKGNREGNSRMLWNDDWDKLRSILLQMLRTSRAALAAVDTQKGGS